MKPKTFRYNEIVTFFEDARAPLSPAQKAVIAERVREEFNLLQDFKEKQKIKADKRLIKRLKRREERASKPE